MCDVLPIVRTHYVSSLSAKHKRQRDLLRVLTYHRVADPDQTPLLHPGLVSATPSGFAWQIGYLAANYHVVSLNEVADCLLVGKALPERAVLITFDDGYFDFEEIAWPILKAQSLPATIFVPTGFPDRRDRCFWWDKLFAAFVTTSRADIQIAALGVLSLGQEQRLQSLARVQNHVKSLPHHEALTLVDDVCEKLGNGPLAIPSTMSWEQLRKLTKEGVTLGAHTCTHPILTRIPLEGAREEIRASHEALTSEVGTVLPVFAYPNGNHNEHIVGILREEGFKLAFTGLRGINDMRSTDPLRLRRLNITRRTNPTIFRMRLLKWFIYIDKWRHRKRRHVDYFGDNAE